MQDHFEVIIIGDGAGGGTLLNRPAPRAARHSCGFSGGYPVNVVGTRY
jgi:hypothetical protein